MLVASVVAPSGSCLAAVSLRTEGVGSFGVSGDVASQLLVAANRRSLRWSSCLRFFVLRYWCVLVEEVMLIED